ncbi:hypothetical protein V6N11_056386 [Hibiscus sabdariffa]|uniref:Uncharacterized protein n=1 Tax=Hibiscus sabdariffa TaxID=183260 RepID=A0ABR2T3L9_9ROSI
MGVESTAERGSTWSCKRISPKVSVEILRRKNTSKLLEANPLTALGKTGNGKVDKKNNYDWSRKSVGRTQPPIAEATGNGGGNGVTGNKSDLGASESTEESVSNSKFDTGRSDEKTTEVDRNRSSTEEEAFQAMWVERDCIDGGTREHESLRGQIKLSELMGEEPKVTTAIAAKETGVGKTREVEELRENKGGSVVSHAGMSQGQDAGKDCGLENYPLRNVVSQSGLEPIRVDWGVEADVVEHRGGGFNGQLPEIKNLWAKAEFGNN